MRGGCGGTALQETFTKKSATPGGGDPRVPGVHRRLRSAARRPRVALEVCSTSRRSHRRVLPWVHPGPVRKVHPRFPCDDKPQHLSAWTATAGTSSARSSTAPGSRCRRLRRGTFAVSWARARALAGFFGGRRHRDHADHGRVLAFPLLLAIAIVTPGLGLFNAIIAISIVNIPIYARVAVRGCSRARRRTSCGGRALGVSDGRIMADQVLPNWPRRSWCRPHLAWPPPCWRWRPCRSSGWAAARSRRMGRSC